MSLISPVVENGSSEAVGKRNPLRSMPVSIMQDERIIARFMRFFKMDDLPLHLAV